jgi:cytolethal distending toxin subunit A
MTIFRHAPAGLVASGVFVLGLFYAAGAVTYAAPVTNELMLVNAKTGKCLTIAGGVSTDNNVTALQFNCDSDPSRTWRISDVTGSGVYQIRNVQTNKCLTIAGGVSTNNNVEAVRFDCDSDLSRRWTIRLKL